MTVLGPLGEMLVEAFPQFRQPAAEMIAEEDEFLEGLEESPEEIAARELSGFQLSSEFRLLVLEPAIEKYPDSVAELRRCIEFMDRVFRQFPNPDDLTHEALGIRAIDHLAQQHLNVLRTASPELLPEMGPEMLQEIGLTDDRRPAV